MRLSPHIQTAVVLTAGTVLGFLAASAQTHQTAHADVGRQVIGDTKNALIERRAEEAARCDAKLNRKLSMADAVADFNAVALAQADKAAKEGKKPNIVIIWVMISASRTSALTRWGSWDIAHQISIEWPKRG